MMNLGDRLVDAIKPHDLFAVRIWGVSIPVTDTVLVTWIIMAFLIISAFALTRGLKTIPRGKQNLAEWFVEFVNGFARTNIGHNWERFAPYLGTVLLFLLAANIVSIFNIIPEIWPFQLRPPTRDVNVTACMALMSIILVLFSGIFIKKPIGWLLSFFKPNPVIAPFKALDYFIRPLSLCFRLFGNILGAFIIMELLNFVMPVIVPAAASIYFDLFDGILQAYIFVFLTSLYIAEAIE